MVRNQIINDLLKDKKDDFNKKIKSSKKSNLIEKSIYIDFFDQIWSLLIELQLFN